ncbi:MAG: glycoside hydrolase family 5 protein [Oscillospiraceae bacterium]|jgi:endoglucanase|nr:glycoside hydrolase family 5 protein [Oscillospiraceae bacterium]
MGRQLKRILFLSLAALIGCQAAGSAEVTEGARINEYIEPVPEGYEPLTGRVDDFTPITPQDFVKSVRIGINAGNTLDALGARGLATETSWSNPRLRPEFFAALKAKGLDIARIPISWEPHIVDFTGSYAIDPQFMDRVQTVVEYALDAGLFVIIDTHHENNHLLPRIANNDTEAAVAEIRAIWTQVAERFSGYNERLIFNLLNEPRAYGAPSEWNGGTKASRDLVTLLNHEALAAVRASGGHNGERLVMLTPHAASVWYALHLDVPADDPYVLVSIHAYEPYDFALNMRGTDKFPERNNLGDVFGTIAKTFTSKGIPVIMDETGAMNKNGNLEDRIAWAEEFAAQAKKHGVPVVLWDNGVTDIAKGESFGLIDRLTLEWVFPEIVEAFLE